MAAMPGVPEASVAEVARSVVMVAGGKLAPHTPDSRWSCMSTCCNSFGRGEEELVALAACAIELIYIMSLLKFIGYECDEDVCVETDNKGAYDLCHRYTSAQHSRHIDRKLFKLREMRGAGMVTVKYLPTDDNTADLFTKVLGRQPFERHRKYVLNLGVRADAAP